MQFSENMLSICPVMPQSHACDSLEGFLNIIGKKKKTSTGLVSIQSIEDLYRHKVNYRFSMKSQCCKFECQWVYWCFSILLSISSLRSAQCEKSRGIWWGKIRWLHSSDWNLAILMKKRWTSLKCSYTGSPLASVM